MALVTVGAALVGVGADLMAPLTRICVTKPEKSAKLPVELSLRLWKLSAMLQPEAGVASSAVEAVTLTPPLAPPPPPPPPLVDDPVAGFGVQRDVCGCGIGIVAVAINSIRRRGRQRGDLHPVRRAAEDLDSGVGVGDRADVIEADLDARQRVAGAVVAGREFLSSVVDAAWLAPPVPSVWPRLDTSEPVETGVDGISFTSVRVIVTATVSVSVSSETFMVTS